MSAGTYQEKGQEMGKRKPLRERPEHERKLDQEQYEMLRRCSEKKDVTEWNDWRQKHPRMPVFLEGADFRRAHLEDANFRLARLEGADFFDANVGDADFFVAHLEGADFLLAHTEGACFMGAHLEGARLIGAPLEGAEFITAHLEGADLWDAHLEGADFEGAHLERTAFLNAHLEGAGFAGAHLERATFLNAHLEGVGFCDAHLKDADFYMAHLEGADFEHAHLEGADFRDAHLEGAYLWNTHLEGANFSDAHLEGAKFHMAAVDGGTLLDTRYVDRQTDFTGVGLDSARVPPGLKQLLEYNVRRLGWENWYQEHQLLRGPVRLFWFMSDYGCSTGRILGCFFALALFFAILYYVCGLAWPPGIVSGLLNGDNIPVPGWLVLVRAVYFSVVTMTTLGFGDIYACPTSFWGHLLLTLQVLLGYVLLAALVTRFAVLFTAGSPAGKFPDE